MKDQRELRISAQLPETRTGILRRHRLWIVLAVLVVLVFLTIRWQDRAHPIDFYRVIDQQTLGIDTTTGPGWTRVTSVVETPTSITVIVSSIQISIGPSADTLTFVELTVRLSSPVGDRAVIDGSTGMPLRPNPGPWPPLLGP